MFEYASRQRPNPSTSAFWHARSLAAGFPLARGRQVPGHSLTGAGDPVVSGSYRSQGHEGTLRTQASPAYAPGHNFSRVPAERSMSSLGKGEVVGSDEGITNLKGNPSEGSVTEAAPETAPEIAPEAEPASKGEGAKTVKKTELAAPSATNCGGYSWRVRFSVENADSSTNGYIVQKVNATYTRKDCAGSDKPVTGIGTFPFWEAWGVRGGKVFIGDTADAHNADTYSDTNMGDSTSGSIVVKGTPEFFPNVTLPAHMKANNPDTQAGSLRSSTTDPGLTGGTGSIAHDLTASWNCCPGSPDKKTQFSNKK